jgi:endonuclease/exonuclease/phosphatase family metal-dependent hydrolase
MRARRPTLSWLVLPLLCWATAASADTLKIATWNMEWLTTRPAGDPALPRDVVPRDPADWPRLQAYAAQLDADVVAFEEVDGPEAAQRVFPPGQYVLHLTADQVVQRVGLAIRRGIGFTANPDDTALDVYGPSVRFPLRSGADVTLHLAGGHELRVLAVHLKSGCWDRPLDSAFPACRTLSAQIPVLRDWIAARRADGIPFIVLGDFNRVMNGGDPLLAALRQGAPLTRATDGFADPCWGGSDFIDHILLGGAAAAWLAPDSLRVLVYREKDDSARAHISDHCPVSIRLSPPS